MRRPIRFRPPALTVPAEVRWMLGRAFGPVDAPSEPGVDPAAALVAARRFEVAPRIASRQGRRRLTAELGAEATGGFLHDRTAAAAVGVKLAEVAAEAAAVAGRLGMPLVALKQLALEASGVVAPGSRSACDADVLVPPGGARDLVRELVARGFRAADGPGEEHHVPALVHPTGGMLEIHVLIPGVRLAGRAAATVNDLERMNLLRPATGPVEAVGPDRPARFAVPVPEVLAAHALVHGVAQHGWEPYSYSLLKTVGDLIDLGLGVEGGGETPSLARLATWISRDVAAGEVAAMVDLCRSLAAGQPVDDASPAGLLLRHALAGRLDPAYARSLKLSLLRRRPSELPAAGRVGRAVVRTLILSRGQIDALYGRPAGRFGYLGRRLWRPFDLLGRMAAAGASSLGSHGRSPRG